MAREEIKPETIAKKIARAGACDKRVASGFTVNPERASRFRDLKGETHSRSSEWGQKCRNLMS